MDSFSWSDALRACLPCLARPAIELDDEQQQQQPSRAPRASLSAREELERLLETDDEAETLSLHSNLGGQRRAKKRGKGKNISLFGFDLFGRRTGGIALPDSDDEGEDGARRAQPRRSSSTLDSDAAPIDDSAIENLSWDAAREAEERERAERRAARRQRKEMKRAAAALAAGVGEDEFEGFPGSGSYLPPSHSQQEFGAFVQAPTPPPSEPQHPQPQHAQVSSNDDDEADFGAELYTRKTSSSVRSGSDARSSSSGGRRRKSAKSSTSASSRRSADELRSPPPAASQFADVAVASPSPPPHLQHGFVQPGHTPSPKTTAFPSTGFGRPSGGARGLSAASFSAALGRSGNDA